MFTTRRIALLLLVLAALMTLAARGLPLVRNSLVYARASEHVIEHGYDPRPVVADSKLSYDKPILYAWVSAPFVAWLGSHDGLRCTSFAGGIAYLLAVLAFGRALGARLEPRRRAALLWLCAAGPCVLYQFWSAHPDGWFAALVIASWTITYRLVEERERRTVRRVLLLGATIYVAILLKNYGLVLLASCPLYLLCHVRRLREDVRSFRRLCASSLGVFVALGVLAWLAWIGWHPLSRLEGEGGGVGQYATGELRVSCLGTWLQLLIALLLQFHVALLLAFRRDAWRRDWISPALCFGGTYVAGLMPFPTTFYNMRYFLPLFPLVGWALVRGSAGLRTGTWRALLATHVVLASALIALFNVAPLHRAALPVLPVLEVDWLGPRLSLLDNLRMPLHLAEQDQLAHVNRVVPEGAPLYLLDFAYYGDAQHGVFERAGLLRGDLLIRYAHSRSFEPAEADCHVWYWRVRPQDLERLGRVTELERNVVRIQR